MNNVAWTDKELADLKKTLSGFYVGQGRAAAKEHIKKYPYRTYASIDQKLPTFGLSFTSLLKPRPIIVPKVLFIDFETSPNLGYSWGTYEQNILHIVKRRMIISSAWKWMGEKQVSVKSLPDFYGYRKDYKTNIKLIKQIHGLFMAADIIVAQNGDNFDIKMANAEFIEYGLDPIPPNKTIDTLKIARSRFRFNSNKLDDLGRLLGVGRKVQTGGFQLWLDCLAGNRKAWKTMIEYNKNDVDLLEKVYMKLRPWANRHPNMNVMDGSGGCPVCRSTNIQRNGFSMTPLGRRRRYHCFDCGKWSLAEMEKPGLTLRA